MASDQPFTIAFDAAGNRVAPPGAPAVADLASALNSLVSCVVASPADWGATSRDAWMYGIVIGWDCEDDHEHDGTCGDGEAMRDLAARHGWDEAEVARLRGYRAAFFDAVGSWWMNGR